MIITCEICGQPFEARRSDARFCSARCRQRNRRRADAPINRTDDGMLVGLGDVDGIAIDAPPVTSPIPVPPITELCSDAARLSHAFAMVGAGGDPRLRPGALRVSRAIADALRSEGWL